MPPPYITKLSKLYWMTLLLPWPSRRMASHGSRVESWDISSGETTATSRRPPAGEERGGRRGKLGILTQIATFATTKKCIFFMKAVKIIPYWSKELPLNNRKWISSWQELFSFASDRDESGREPMFCLISRTLERWTIFISWTHPNHSYYDEQELLSLILKITNLKQFLKWCKF